MIDSLLNDYKKLVTDCRDLMEMEIAEYQAGRGGQDNSLHEIKHDLIEQLGSCLVELRRARTTVAETPLVDKSKINYLQQTFMQLLRLDRELERQLLAVNVPSAASARMGPGSPSLAARMYGQKQMVQEAAR
ncbi:MAG: hypothetical protein AB3N63_12170 [Puniceicoccaceae bacterium]